MLAWSRSEGGLGLGKAPAEVLAVLSAPTAAERATLLQGPGLGRDAALVRWGDEALVITSDPITFVDADVGRLAVAVNANDVFAVGGEPEWLVATVLAPVGIDGAALRGLLVDIQSACRDAGIALVGGHTEVTDAVTRTVVSCTLVGQAPLAQIVPSDGARDGDVIVQAGAAAIEGTAILGHPELLAAPGLSVATAARTLRQIAGVHAMHDVTEGGIATAASELAEAAGLAPRLVYEEILWLQETLSVCADRGLDPLGLLGSGTLLAAVAPEAVDTILFQLSSAGVLASAIGQVRAGIPATLSHVGRDSGRDRPLPRFTRDEALRALADDDPRT